MAYFKIYDRRTTVKHIYQFLPINNPPLFLEACASHLRSRSLSDIVSYMQSNGKIHHITCNSPRGGGGGGTLIFSYIRRL